MKRIPLLRPWILLAALACAAGGAPPASAEQVRWRDAMGREVGLEVPARRIVSLAPSVTEAIFALGADSLLIGVSRHCDYPLEAKLKPRMGNFNSPDLEAVRAAAPDVVLFAEYARVEDLAALERAGTAGLVVPARSVADVMAAIRTLGALSGRGAEAERLAGEIALSIAEIGGRLASVPEAARPRVYVEVDGPEKLYAVGAGSFMDDVVRLAGGRNVFAGRESAYFPVAAEEVVRADPEVILVDYPFQYKVGVAKRPGWDVIAAVRERRVYDGTDYDTILFNRPGPRIARALREISRLLHPRIFP